MPSAHEDEDAFWAYFKGTSGVIAAVMIFAVAIPCFVCGTCGVVGQMSGPDAPRASGEAEPGGQPRGR